MLSKKRKFNEIESEEQIRVSKSIKSEKKIFIKKKEYICFKHDHNKQTCLFYDCMGITTYKTNEDLRRYYLF